jgi:LmbE family N-acetylglucosaminyl deacetylase
MSPQQLTAILSPHLDDAVLSCWRLLTAPGDVAVLNVCTGIPPDGAAAGFWDLLTGGDDPSERMRQRRAEDEAALRLAGRSAHQLGFVDFQYAGSQPAVGPLVESVRAILEPGARVYAPLALGAHPDHLATRAAGIELGRFGFEVAFYADLPHAVRPGWLAGLATAPEHAGLGAVGLTPSQHRLDDAELAAKLHAVGEYRTQLGGLEGMLGAPVTDRDVLRHEVVWTAPSSSVSPVRRARRSGTPREALRPGATRRRIR